MLVGAFIFCPIYLRKLQNQFDTVLIGLKAEKLNKIVL